MPERSHTPMGHAHCTSGAPTCSEIPHSLAWSRKAPSIHDVPRGGTVRVLTNRDVKPSGRVLRLCPAFCLREARWWLQLEVRKTSNLHYTTALHTISPVFSHHTTISPVFSHHTTYIPLMSHVQTLRKNDIEQDSTCHRTTPNQGTGRFQIREIMHKSTPKPHTAY